MQGGFRKTRITTIHKPGKMDLNHNVSKLSYLSRLHVAIELIYLVKAETNFHEDTFDYICESVYKNYIEKPQVTSKDVSDFQDLQICNFEVKVELPENKLIKK